MPESGVRREQSVIGCLVVRKTGRARELDSRCMRGNGSSKVSCLWFVYGSSEVEVSAIRFAVRWGLGSEIG